MTTFGSQSLANNRINKQKCKQNLYWTKLLTFFILNSIKSFHRSTQKTYTHESKTNWQQQNTDHFKGSSQRTTENVGIIESVVTFRQLNKVYQRIVLDQQRKLVTCWTPVSDNRCYTQEHLETMLQQRSPAQLVPKCTLQNLHTYLINMVVISTIN